MQRTSPEMIGRTAIAALIGGLTIVAIVAARLTPPAGAIADRYSTLAAIIVVATVLTLLITQRDRLGRPGRLAAVVTLLATGMAWYSGRQWVHEKYFDYLVTEQKAELETMGVELSGEIGNFLRDRAAGAPPRPRPASWDRDEAEVFRYEQETSVMFEQRFGLQVRRTRDMFSLRGLRDRDLDNFYVRPSNAFQIDVIARRLAVLAHRLERT